MKGLSFSGWCCSGDLFMDCKLGEKNDTRNLQWEIVLSKRSYKTMVSLEGLALWTTTQSSNVGYRRGWTGVHFFSSNVMFLIHFRLASELSVTPFALSQWNIAWNQNNADVILFILHKLHCPKTPCTLLIYT